MITNESIKLSKMIDWSRASVNPVALLILPWDNGVAIAKRDKNGRLYGCRDVTNAPGKRCEFVSTVAAWIVDARKNNLKVEDRADAVETIRAHAKALNESVKGVTSK